MHLCAIRICSYVIQVLDGMSASVFGILVPLIVVDVTYGSGHFNVAQGIVGTATGIGASVSMVFAGYISDHFGAGIAFLRWELPQRRHLLWFG